MGKILVNDLERRRLDIYLKEHLNLPRTTLQELIRTGKVIINNKTCTKPSYKIKYNDLIVYELPKEDTSYYIKRQPIDINIIYEDDYIIVVNKPPGILTHPTHKIKENTLLNAILYHTNLEYPSEETLRPGIVHRLDKDTSGLLILAKKKSAYFNLIQQFKERRIYKEYIGVVWGELKEDKKLINIPIGYSRCGGLVKKAYGRKHRYAQTYIKIIEKLPNFTILRIIPYTGRTHQIRVHLKYIGYPLVGDKLYAKKQENEKLIQRHALHANKLMFRHPISDEFLTFNCSLPEDISQLIEKIRCR